MSDNWLMFIPADPEALPSRSAADNGVEVLRRIAPTAIEVVARFCQKTEFFHGMENWSGAVNCPKCGADALDWWKEAMNKSWESEFTILNVITPCCRHSTSLNNLNYAWPAAFGRFVLKAMNPGLDTSAQQDQVLAETLGVELRKIWMHI